MKREVTSKIYEWKGIRLVDELSVLWLYQVYSEKLF